MMECIYGNYIDDKTDENGRLTRIRFTPSANFNFAYDIVDEAARLFPDKRAMIWLSKNKERREFSFADMKRLSDKTANYLSSLGITRNDRVLLVLKRRWQFWTVMLALCKLGAVAIPASFLLKRKDYVYRLNSAEIKAVICCAEPAVLCEVDAAQSECPSLKIKLCADGDCDGWLSLDEGVDAAPEAFSRRETAVHDAMLMYFSSGTTGYPKIAVHDYTYALGHFVTAKYWHHVTEDGIHLTVADTGWGKAAWGKLYGQWICGTTVFVYDFDHFSAADLLGVIADNGITSFCAPPTIYRFLLLEDLSKYDLFALRYATTAGEALSPEIFKSFKKATGIKIMEGFGQTETTLTVATLYGSKPRFGSMGLASPQYDISLIDAEGAEVSPGSVGEIAVRTDKGAPCGLFSGYYRDEQRTRECWHDGLYRTGDLAWRDEDGYFWYVGRADDIIKSSGYRIGPFEIESVLMEHPAVLECAVTGHPDPVRGQIVKATIVLREGYEASEALAEELKTFTKNLTAPYKYPRIVEFTRELPKTVNGKIKRHSIREKA